MPEDKVDIEIGLRILELLNTLKTENNSNPNNPRLGKVGFATSIGVDPSQFSRILKGMSGISFEALLELSSKYGVNLHWIITGEGSIFKKESGTTQAPDQDLLTKILQLQETQTALLKQMLPNSVQASSILNALPGSGEEEIRALVDSRDNSSRVSAEDQRNKKQARSSRRKDS